MTLRLASLWLVLTLPLGPGPSSLTLDAGASLALELPGPGPGVAGLSTPIGYVLWPASLPDAWSPYARWEEAQHVEQWTALGPAFVLVYLLAMGEGIEPYWPRDPLPLDYDPGLMWEPDVRRCPLLRYQAPQRLAWAPCWRFGSEGKGSTPGQP